MDLASLVSAAKAPSSGGAKKYQKRSEIEAQRQAEYQREQEELERARLERLEKKRKRDEEETEKHVAREEKRKRLAEESRRIREEEEEQEEAARRKRLGLPELVKDKPLDTPPLEEIPDDELKIRLHDLSEPRTLFGETHTDRLRRYHSLITASSQTPVVWTKGPIPTTLTLLPEAEMKVPSTVPSSLTAQTHLFRQLASYFDLVLSSWSRALAQRPAEVKATPSGKQALSHFHLACDNLTPLFRKLETSSLEPELVAPILEIVDLAQQKRYVHANDAYLRLSIGKAAWPIGVTMVGIHERSAREKLHGGNTAAHIMTDETTRKMLQGMKRCLSFAQTRWPPKDVGQLMG
ncbi:hypothetical protein MBLNU230_g1901t1 [Neophaeotheca triangularis]